MKKMLALITAICMLLSTAFAAYGEHEHELMKMANSECHYEECTVCFELFNVGDHVFETGKCTVCGHAAINPFADVKDTDWFYDDVLTAVGMHLINGKSVTRYAPNEFITYAEVLKLAACMNQKFLNGNVTLENGTPWYQPYVDYCAINKIAGAPADHMNKYATRAWFMTTFASALPESEFEEINVIEDGTIPDVVKGSDFYDVAYKLYRAGIVTGADAQHNCKPDSNIKRSEVAAILVRMMAKEKRIKFTMIHEKNVLKDDETEIVETPPTTVAPDLEKDPIITPDINTDPLVTPGIVTDPLEIKTQPQDMEVSGYGAPGQLTVEVEGGIKPYTYQWKYRDRRDTVEVFDNDTVRGAATDTLTVYTSQKEALIGKSLYCTVTDALGNTVSSNAASIYGPFMMKMDDWAFVEQGVYTLIGTLTDGLLKPGEKLSVERNGKIIAFCTVEKIEMFGKSVESAVKGDTVGITVKLIDGYAPSSGDTVFRYQDYHEIDGSDIIN